MTLVVRADCPPKEQLSYSGSLYINDNSSFKLHFGTEADDQGGTLKVEL